MKAAPSFSATGDHPAVAAGQVRLWCRQSALHGVEALLVFRWQAPRAGPEQYPGGLLRHDRIRGPAWHEAARFVGGLRAAQTATEVLGRAHGGPLDGAPVVVRRGGLTYLGAGSEPAWTEVLTRLLGRRAHPHHLEVFDRDHGHDVIDHRALSVDGIGEQGPAGVGTT